MTEDSWMGSFKISLKKPMERGKRRKRGVRRVTVPFDLKQLFLCGALKMDPCSFSLHLATLFMLPVNGLWWNGDLLLSKERERKSIWSAEKHCRFTWFSYTLQSCEEFLLALAFWHSQLKEGLFSASKWELLLHNGMRCDNYDVTLTLQSWHWSERLSSLVLSVDVLAYLKQLKTPSCSQQLSH